jgi:hypothetical protein
MGANRLIVFSVLLALLSVGAVDAQIQRSPTGETRTLEIVDQLKDIIQRLERNRNTDPTALQQLRDLVRRYDWPWRARLLSTDFSDSNYRLESNWVIDQGDFRVARGAGLRTVFVPPARSATQKKEESSSLGGMLGGIIRGMTEPERSDQPAQPSAAEIHTELRINNAFALSLQIDARGPSQGDGRLEFGPYLGRERSYGYRLAYNPGKRSAFELLRVSPGRSAVVETSQDYADLDDGRPHNLEWRRATDGEMVVILDGKEMLRTLDRGAADDFDGITIVNAGGEYTISRLEIFGATR